LSEDAKQIVTYYGWIIILEAKIQNPSEILKIVYDANQLVSCRNNMRYLINATVIT
jgi:hypothetical protein